MNIITLNSFMTDLNDVTKIGYTLKIPAALKMDDSDQQDAQEYFMNLTGKVEKDIKTIYAQCKNQQRLQNLAPAQIKNIRTAGLTENENDDDGHSERPITDPRHPLEGHLAQRVCCMRCGYADGLTMIPFNCLTLSPGRHNFSTLSACLDNYTQLELIEDVQCNKCTVLYARLQGQADLQAMPQILENFTETANTDKLILHLKLLDDTLAINDFGDARMAKLTIPAEEHKKSNKSKQVVISRPPACLAVHINRSLFDDSTYEITKNYVTVKIPDILNLGRWCLGMSPMIQMRPEVSMLQPDPEDTTPTLSTYNLQAVIVHQGRHGKGHYIAYRKIQPSKTSANDDHDDRSVSTIEEEVWWELSDEMVRSVSQSQMESAGDVYMAFYTRAAENMPKDPCSKEHMNVETIT